MKKERHQPFPDMVHACLLRSALAPTLRIFAGRLLREHSSLTEQATGNLRFSGFRSSGKHAFGRASGTAPSEENRRTTPFQQLCRKRRRQRPVSASRAKRPSPALHQKRSAARVRSGKNGAGARSRSPVRRPRRLQSMFPNAVTSSRNACSKSSTSSSFWNWSSLPQPSWRNSSS